MAESVADDWQAPGDLAAPLPITVLGAGLAGSEAAWQLARRGHRVRLVEMRPGRTTPAHTSGLCAELVCSNSLKSEELDTAHGVLKEELALAGSLLLQAARRTRVGAGHALAVDRHRFAALVTATLQGLPGVELVAAAATSLPEPGDGLALGATGPLTAAELAAALAERVGQAHLSFYDALAPIVDGATIDQSLAFWGTRYDKGEPDYLNCPLDPAEYLALWEGLSGAARVQPRPFEEVRFFEGCQPVEQIAMAGAEALRFGPCKPVGLFDPRTGRPAYAVVQLRRENAAGSAFNLVGFQTRLTQPEQRAVLRRIPALREASFLRYGAIHRNTYLDAPRVLRADLSLRTAPHLFVAGQLTGGEGYLEAVATGLAAALALDARLAGRLFAAPPPTTVLGGLLRYLRQGPIRGPFAPSNAHFGLLDEPELVFRGRGSRRQRRLSLAERALTAARSWWQPQPGVVLAGPGEVLASVPAGPAAP